MLLPVQGILIHTFLKPSKLFLMKPKTLKCLFTNIPLFANRGMTRFLVIASLLFSSALPAVAQSASSAWTIFGDPSLFATTGCNVNNQMSCTTPPGTTPFSSVGLQDPLNTLSSATVVDMFKNSIYDNAGWLLFSVNADGIYAADALGTQIYPFNGQTLTNNILCPSATPVYTNVGYSISEITAFPAPGKCNAYYLVFWSTAVLSGSSPYVLRCIEIDVTMSLLGSTSVSSSSWYNIVQDVLLDPPYCAPPTTSFPYDWPTNNFFYGPTDFACSFNVVAGPTNYDYSRDVYTVDAENTATGSITTALRKWHFPTNGALPAYYPPAASAGYASSNVSNISTASPLYPPVLTKTKIFLVKNGTGGTDQILAYLGNDMPGTAYSDRSDVMQTYDFTTGDEYVYKAPILSGVAGHQRIFGFELLPDFTFCFSFVDGTYYGGDCSTNFNLLGGLGYATLSTGAPVTPISMVPTTTSTLPYGYSDLELDQNGDMYMQYTAFCYTISTTSLTGMYATQLAFVSSASLDYSTFMSGSTTPIIYSSPCSGPSSPYNVSILNYQPSLVDPNEGINNYLCTQLRGNCGGGPVIAHITTPPSTCSGGFPTFTATLNSGSCATNYSWYKSVDGGAHYSLVSYGSSNTFTDVLASDAEKVYCIVTVSSGCSAGDYTSNTATVSVTELRIADVDINSVCAPHTLGADIAEPQFTVTLAGGSGSYSFSWVAQTSDNNVTLSSLTDQNPMVTGIVNSSNPLIADYILTVHDGGG